MEISKILGPALRLPFRASRSFQNSSIPSASSFRSITTKSSASASSQPSCCSLLNLAIRTRDHPSSPRKPTTHRNLTTTPTTHATGRSPSSGLSTLGARLGAAQAAQSAPVDPRLQHDAKHPQERQPWHLHVYATKHNTHLTLTRPNRDAVISISAGQIGFKKAARGSYDAAYQLGAYMMARIQRAGLLQQIDETELVFRGHGSGREAISKILTGTEGAMLRHKIKSVTDSTRLKFGGTRSPKRRRLG